MFDRYFRLVAATALLHVTDAVTCQPGKNRNHREGVMHIFKSVRTASAVLSAIVALSATPAWAGDADIIGVHATSPSAGLYDFAVTVRSKDTGWDRYADRLEAVSLDGMVIATRTLDHPHDDEQPFTRDIRGVRINGPAKIIIRAHFKPTGFDGATTSVSLPGDAS
jgi:hypothetical protein